MPVLCVVGDLVEDVVVRSAGTPQRGTDTPARIVRRRGGSAANVAVAAARAGCPTRFIGRVGDDDLGDQLVAALEDAEVDVQVQRGSEPTGAVVVLVEPGGERTMLPDRGAAVGLGPVDPSWLEGVTWLHAPAYSLCAEPIGASTLAALRHVRGAWGRCSVDVSSAAVVRAYGVEAFRGLVTSIAPDVLFANEDEVALVDGVAVPLLVVKHGAEATELVHARRELVPVDRLDGVVDTTGAGDAFAGGFLAATLAGADPATAATAGHAAAAAVLAASAGAE